MKLLNFFSPTFLELGLITKKSVVKGSGGSGGNTVFIGWIKEYILF